MLEIILCSGFPSQLLLIGILYGLGMRPDAGDGRMNPRFVFTLSLLDAVFVIGLVLFLLRAHRESARDVLFGHLSALREAAFGVLLVPVVLFIIGTVFLVLLRYAPQLHNVPRNPFEDMLQNRFDIALFAVVVMVAGGVREEIQRGFIIHRFGQYLGGEMTGVIVFSVLFGAGHYQQGYDATIGTGILGAFWGLVYLRRRSVLAPMVSHAGFNLTQILNYVLR